jgi:Domain of unknown function (DUF4114)
MAIINGTPNDDIIIGDLSGNTLTGGLGRDIFEITGVGVSTPTTPNTITDFNQLDDTIQVDLPTGSQISGLTTAQAGNDTIVSFGSKQLAIVQNTLVSALQDKVISLIEAPVTTVVNLPPTAIAFNNSLTTIQENTDTTIRIRIADLVVSDDIPGTNNLSLSGADAGSFELEGTSLFLKAGTVLDFETKSSLNFSVNVDDPAVGATPDITRSFTLAITDIAGEAPPPPPAPTPTTIFTPLNTGLLQLSQGVGTVTALLFSKISNQAANRNELGVFAVDGDNGNIRGILPGQAGYLTEVLTRSQVVFSALGDSGVNATLNGAATRNINLPTNSRLGFYLAVNGTVGDANPNVIFSLPSANNSFQSARITQAAGNTQIAFEDTPGGGDRDFNDLVFQIENATNLAPIGSSQQGSREVFDLTAVTGPTTATFEVGRDAGFNDRVGFYRIDNAQGGITVGGTIINPGDAGYRQAVVQNRLAGIDLNGTNGQTLTSTGNFQGGGTYAAFLISNGNSANADFSNVYTAYRLGNADQADHIRLLGDNTFGFEDLAGGGDRDFNDLIVKATFG